jgi:HKD family nuclease
MSRVVAIAQPSIQTTLDAIGNVLQTPGIQAIDVAVAYITAGGAHDLIGRISDSLGDRNDKIAKRWVTSFDYCRTQPLALDAIRSLPNSHVRIYDAAKCLAHSGVPTIPFHPKTFLFRGKPWEYVLSGSGNVSRSGLSKGVEAGLVIGIDRSQKQVNPTAAESIDRLQSWFDGAWNNASILTKALLGQYRTLYESIDNLSSPVPTEDDVVASDPGQGGLSNTDLRRLRACEYLWIEAGKITKNRGPKLPGNQLMMKRLSRVYFGFPSSSVPENTAIGTVELSFAGKAVKTYSLTYSDNGMDKLVLPIPVNDGPASYDDKFILFRAVGPRRFEVALGSTANRSTWLKKSNAISGAFKMTSGRQWGVF